MKEYLINSGDFEIIVRPEVKEYHILDEADDVAAVVNKFIKGEHVPYESFNSYWFKYEDDETWEDLDKNTFVLNDNFSESDLMDHFVLKKYNAGSLIAYRDTEISKIKIFKQDKIKELVTR